MKKAAVPKRKVDSKKDERVGGVDWVGGGSPQRNPEVAHVEPGAERGVFIL